MPIVTDATPLEDPKPDTCHVFALFKLFSNEAEQAELAESTEQVDLDMATQSWSCWLNLKLFAPCRLRRTWPIHRPLRTSFKPALKARKTARETMARVYEATGVSPRKVGR